MNESEFNTLPFEERRRICRDGGVHLIRDTDEDFVLCDSVVLITWSTRYNAVMESWNRFASDVGLKTIRRMNDRRKAHVRSRFDDIWPHLPQCYEKIKASPFLLGEGRDGWTLTFDALWGRASIFDRIMEGNYDRSEPVRAGEFGPDALKDLARDTEQAVRNVESRRGKDTSRFV